MSTATPFPNLNAAKAATAQNAIQSADDLLKEFNDRYFVVNESGRVVIYEPQDDPQLNRRVCVRMSFGDFKKLYSNKLVEVPNGTSVVMRNAATFWLSHPDRKQYTGGVTFDPANRNGSPDVFNLWQGFAVEPRKGSWANLQAHLLDVICNNDQRHADYVLDWMADAVQHPAKQGEVAIVMRGDEGSGKGILARTFKRLFGQHGFHISNARHLIGNFNAHLRDVVFLFADEAFYAGDRAHVGVLKALITEPYLTIEGKNMNVVQAPNFLHLMLASNEDWVIPAGLNSRRFLMLDVSDRHANEHKYFAEIQQELDQGGYEAMLHDLLHRDISKTNLRAVPVTKALQEQRKRSVDTVTKWWLDCLHRGWVVESKLGLEDHWQHWHEFLPTQALFDGYERYAREHHERHPLTRELFGKWLASTGAIPDRKRKQAVGEHLVEATTTTTPGGSSYSGRVAELIMQDNPRGYTLGKLEDARAAFGRWSGLEVKWDA